MGHPAAHNGLLAAGGEPAGDLLQAGGARGDDQLIGGKLCQWNGIPGPLGQRVGRRNHSDPRLAVHMDAVQTLSVEGIHDQAKVAQALVDPGLHLVGIAVPQAVLHLGIILVEPGDPGRKQPGSVPLHRGQVQAALQALFHVPDVLG